MFESDKILHEGRFCLEFEYRIVVPGEERNELEGVSRDLIYGEAVGQLSCSYSNKSPARAERCLQFGEQVIGVAVYRDGGGAEVVLQYAVRTVHGAVGGDVQEIVAAARVPGGAGTWFQERTPVVFEAYRFLARLVVLSTE